MKYSFQNYYDVKEGLFSGLFGKRKPEVDDTMGGQISVKTPDRSNNDRFRGTRGNVNADAEQTIDRMHASRNFMAALSMGGYNPREMSSLTQSGGSSGNKYTYFWQYNFYPSIKAFVDAGEEDKARNLMRTSIQSMQDEHGMPPPQRKVRTGVSFPDPSHGLNNANHDDVSDDEDKNMPFPKRKPADDRFDDLYDKETGKEDDWEMPAQAMQAYQQHRSRTNWRKKPITERIAEAHRLAESGASLKAIAAHLGVHVSTARRYVALPRPTSDFGAGNTHRDSNILRSVG